MQEQQCIISQRTYQQLCRVTVLVLTKKLAFLLKGLIERLAVVEHKTLLWERKWNLSNETAAHSRPRWRTNAPSITDPPPLANTHTHKHTPTSRRESISHTCRGYGGKIHAGEGSLPRFYSQSFQGRRFVLVFWFLAGRRCQD